MLVGRVVNDPFCHRNLIGIRRGICGHLLEVSMAPVRGSYGCHRWSLWLMSEAYIIVQGLPITSFHLSLLGIKTQCVYHQLQGHYLETLMNAYFLTTTPALLAPALYP